MGAIKTSQSFEKFGRLPDQPGKQELPKRDLIEARIVPQQDFAIGVERPDAARKAAHARGGVGKISDVYFETGCQHSRHTYVVPDVSVNHVAQQEGKYFGDAPAIAIEVISSSHSAAMDLKTELYFESMAFEVCQFFPQSRRIIVHTHGQARVVRGEQALTIPPLPAFSLPVREILGE